MKDMDKVKSVSFLIQGDSRRRLYCMKQFTTSTSGDANTDDEKSGGVLKFSERER